MALVDQAITNATSFFTGVILSRVCTKDDFGIYTLGFTIITFLLDLQTSIISTPYTIYSPKIKGEEHARYTGSTIIHQVLFSMVAMMLLICGGLLLSLGIGPKSLETVIWALTTVVLFILLREYIRRVCFALLQINIAFMVDISIAIIQITGLLLFAHYHRLGISQAFRIMGIACLIVTCIWLITFRKKFSINLAQVSVDFKQNFYLGKWIFFSGLVWLIATQLYPWFLTHYHGSGSAGVFGVCMAAIAIANPIFYGLSNFIEPKQAHIYAQNGSIKLRQFAIKASLFFIGVLSLFCIAVVFWGDNFIKLVYGEKYAGNSIIIILLALNTLVMAANFPFSRSLFTIERADLVFKSNIFALGITVTLGLWLVRDFGTLGAAISLLVSNVTGSIFRFIAFSSLVPTDGYHGRERA